MKDLLKIQSQNGVEVVDSRVIAELIGIQHKNLLETIDRYKEKIESDFGPLAFETDFDTQRVTGIHRRLCFFLTEDQALFITTLSRNNDRVVELKSLLVQAFQAARRQRFHLPQTYAEALRELATTLDEKEKLQTEKLLLENKVAADAPKVDLVDSLINTDDCFTSSVIAQDHNISAISFHRKLQSAGIIRKVEGIWILTAKYAARDYGRMRTFLQTDQEGIQHARMSLVWTQRGRAFLDWFFKKTPVKSEQ